MEPSSGLRSSTPTPLPVSKNDELERMLAELYIPPTPAAYPVALQALTNDFNALRIDFDDFKNRVTTNLRSVQTQIDQILDILTIMQQAAMGFNQVRDDVAGVTAQFKKLNERQNKALVILEKLQPEKPSKGEKD